MSNMHLWAMVGIVTVLMLSTAFFYKRSENDSAEAKRLDTRYRQLEAMLEGQDISTDIDGNFARKEAEIRAQYEARDRAMTDELSRLYDLEREVRIVSNLPPAQEDSGQVPRTTMDGQGGTPDGSGAGLVFEDFDHLNPPRLLNGVVNPSADLILEEMGIRVRSMDSLVRDFRARNHLTEHTPSGWPTDDARRRINSNFGVRSDPFTHKLRQHSGVDISADYGSAITATAEGVVIFSGYHQFLGHLVKINHGYETETWYGHMSRRVAQKGDVVQKGGVIGKVGSTGRSTGPHIHYEVHVNGGRINPRNYIGQ